MPSPAIESLLILQDRDAKRLGLEALLKAVPRDVALVEGKIAAEKAAIETAKQELRELETKKKLLETEIGSAETKLAKYKTQQSLVKKNAEYQALGHEITRYEKDLDDFETKELEAMEEVDGFRKALKATEAALAQTRKLVEEDLASIAERHARTQADRTEVTGEREKLVKLVPEDLIPLYNRLMKTKAGLAIAPLRDGKCEGCHMKLIASTVVAVQNAKELTRCEDCGRILYAGE